MQFSRSEISAELVPAACSIANANQLMAGAARTERRSHSIEELSSSVAKLNRKIFFSS